MNIKDVNLSPSTYFIFREQSRTFQDIGVTMGYALNVTGLGEPEHVSGLAVTDGMLPILGVTPMLGRLFTRADDSPGSADTVIADLRLLAPQVRRRPLRDREDHHSGRKASPNHRRAAAGFPF